MKKNILYLSIAVLIIIIAMISGGNNDNEKEPMFEIDQSQVSQEQQNQEQSISDKIESLADFENSKFCKDLKCNKEDSWQLNSGGTNYYYFIPLGGDKYNYITVEVTIKNKQVTEFGLIYYDRELSGLSLEDLEIAYKLLNSINSTRDVGSVKNYIAQNIEKEIFQINRASPISWGPFNIYAGKIGQQIISIERVK